MVCLPLGRPQGVADVAEKNLGMPRGVLYLLWGLDFIGVQVAGHCTYVRLPKKKSQPAKYRFSPL